MQDPDLSSWAVPAPVLPTEHQLQKLQVPQQRGILRQTNNPIVEKENLPQNEREHKKLGMDDLINAVANRQNIRSTSAQSRKSRNGDTEKQAPANPAPKPNVRETTVVFGRTTLVKDTIQGMKHPVVAVKPPVGSTRDILDIRNMVESQAEMIKAQGEEISNLRKYCHDIENKYIYLLNQNSDLWKSVNDLRKSAAQVPDSGHSLDTPMNALRVVETAPTSRIEKHIAPLDSIAIKHLKEHTTKKSIEGGNSSWKRDGTSSRREKSKKTEESQLVAVREDATLSAIQRKMESDPEYAKQIAEITKKMQNKAHVEIPVHQKKRDKHQHGHRQQENNPPTSILERFTYEKKVIHHDKSRNKLDSTIDDTLADCGLLDRSRRDHSRNRYRQQEPRTPTIVEASSSEESEAENHHLSQESAIQEHHAESTIGFTGMPDHFNDDDDDPSNESDTTDDTPPAPPRRQPVADRLRKHGRR